MIDKSFHRFFDVTKNPQPRLEKPPRAPKKPKHRGMIVWNSAIQGPYVKARDFANRPKYYGK